VCLCQHPFKAQGSYRRSSCWYGVLIKHTYWLAVAVSACLAGCAPLCCVGDSARVTLTVLTGFGNITRCPAGCIA
jgi:hypothetical protein